MKLGRLAGVRCLLIILVSVTALTLAEVRPASSRPATPKPSRTKSSLIAHGKYLVEDAVQCQNCHTPRDEKGEFIKEQWLRGANFLPATVLKERPKWVEKSANIAGLPGWTDEQAVRFLMTGLAYNDLPARPPMPPYRFNREDAEAIVAYLRSLAGPAK
jgi:mono/diheme cytochrome c family protein